MMVVQAHSIPQPQYTTICKCTTYFDTNDTVTAVKNATIDRNNVTNIDRTHILSQRPVMENRTTIMNLNDILEAGTGTLSGSTAKV